MKNLQKDSPGSQWEQQLSCQAVVASRCVLICCVARALSRVCHANPLAQRNDDNFVAPNVSQSASLFYKRAIRVKQSGSDSNFCYLRRPLRKGLWRLHPVLQPQAWHPLELARVVRDQGCVQAQCMGSNHGV